MNKPLQLYKAVGCRDASEVQRSFKETAWCGWCLALVFGINAGRRNNPSSQNTTLKHLRLWPRTFETHWITQPWGKSKVPGLLTFQPKITHRQLMPWAPDKQSSSHLTLTQCLPDAHRSFWRFLRGTAHLWGNLWSCTTSLAGATGASLICATEHAGYSDLPARSSPGLKSRAEESTQVPIQGKTRLGVPKWPSKKLTRTRRVPLKQACWKRSQSSLLFWLKARHGSTALFCWDRQGLSEGGT